MKQPAGRHSRHSATGKKVLTFASRYVKQVIYKKSYYALTHIFYQK